MSRAERRHAREIAAEQEIADAERRLAECEARWDDVRAAVRILERNLQETLRSARRLRKTIGDDADLVGDDADVTSTLGDVRADG